MFRLPHLETFRQVMISGGKQKRYFGVNTMISDVKDEFDSKSGLLVVFFFFSFSSYVRNSETAVAANA